MPFVNPKKNSYPTDPKQIPAEAQQQVQSAMSAVLQETEAQVEEIDEVERRAIKADAYRKVIHMQIFGDNEEPEFYEVEKEIQAYARERMRVFLGMDPDTRTPAQKSEPVVVELPFTEQQIQVLASWADGLIQRPQLLAATSAPVRGRPVEAPPTPPQSASTTSTPVATPPQARQAAPTEPGKRGRGRPPGTGKNQRAAAIVTTPQEQGPAPTQKITGDAFNEMKQKLAADYPGVKIEVDPDSGRPYLMVERIVDGATAFIRVDAADQTKPVGVTPKPWPTGHSPLENEGGVNRMNISGDVNPALAQQLNGLVKQFQ